MSQIYGHWRVHDQPKLGTTSFLLVPETAEHPEYTVEIACDVQSGDGAMTGLVLNVTLPLHRYVDTTKSFLSSKNGSSASTDRLTIGTKYDVMPIDVSEFQWVMWFLKSDLKDDFTAYLVVDGITPIEFRLTKKRTGDSF
jgi:hypothetical protein